MNWDLQEITKKSLEARQNRESAAKAEPEVDMTLNDVCRKLDAIAAEAKLTNKLLAQIEYNTRS